MKEEAAADDQRTTNTTTTDQHLLLSADHKCHNDPDFSILPILHLFTGSCEPATCSPVLGPMSIKDAVPVLPRINSYPDMSAVTTRGRRRSSVDSMASSSLVRPGKAKSMINLWNCKTTPSATTIAGSVRGGRRRGGGRDTECSSDRNGCLYTPVEFEINTPDKLPYMGKEYRQVGKVKRVATETSAIKQNMVQNKTLERAKDNLGKRSEQVQKEYTRKLTLWHMELERNKNHKDPALQRRTMRILKFIDKMSQAREDFHFKDGFFLDLMDPQYLPEPSPPPVRKDLKRPITKAPLARDPVSRSTGHFKRRDEKREALAARFSECGQAGEVPSKGYVYVKVYSDPYYRYLPPLSAASKNYDVRVCRLPYKELRDEEQWGKFVESLNRPTTPPAPTKSPATPTTSEVTRQRTEELRRKLPVISLLPKWMQAVNDVKSKKYKPAMETIRSRPTTREAPTRAVADSIPVTRSVQAKRGKEEGGSPPAIRHRVSVR